MEGKTRKWVLIFSFLAAVATITGFNGKDMIQYIDSVREQNYREKANTAFNCGNFEEAVKWYKKVQKKIPEDKVGYNKFLNTAKQMLHIRNGECDSNVKKLLKHAQELNASNEVVFLLNKCS